MSFFDDMSNFGSGLLDDVGEGVGNLITSATTATQKEASTNSATTQQPQVPVKDNNGNAVTGNVPIATNKDNTLLYVGGGLGVAVVLIGLVIAIKS